MPINITEYLQKTRDTSIKKALDLLDMSDIDDNDKKRVRQSILDGFNDLYNACCITLTYVQDGE